MKAQTRPSLRLAAMPLAIEANVGQGQGGAAYLAHAGAMQVGFFPERVVMALPLSKSKRSAQPLGMSFVGNSQAPLLFASEKGPGESNYLLGSTASNWHTHVAQYDRLTYKSVYPGIDVTFYGKGQQLEHDFIVEPGADYRAVRLRYDGARKLTLSQNGDLHIATEGGDIVMRAPLIYQTQGGARQKRSGGFILRGNGEVSFRVHDVDRTQPLIIDPVLDYSTYLANLSLYVQGVAVDSSGATYIVGQTFSNLYPVTAGAFQTTCNSCASDQGDLFITKLNATGTAQVYSTYLGGNNLDQPLGIAVDAGGNAVVIGFTSSTDFPLRNAISSGVPSGGDDGFVSSIAPDGASLNFSTRLGGVDASNSPGTTQMAAVATDAGGNVYVSGETASTGFPVTPGALHAAIPSDGDGAVFLAKIGHAGSLVYGALLGDPGQASEGVGPSGMAVDPTGDVYIAGTVGPVVFTTTNPWPTTPGAYQAAFIAPVDNAPFVSKVSSNGSTLLYSTLLTTGHAYAMALTNAGQVIVAGSPNTNYPITSDAYSSLLGSSFVAKLSADGTQLLYSTYFSTPSGDTGGNINSVAVDTTGNVWIAGNTYQVSNVPLVNPLQSTPGVGGTGFVSEFDPLIHTLLFSTYFNGIQGGTRIAGLALDTQGRAHITGTGQDDLPTTSGTFLGSVTPPPPNYDYTYGFAALIDASQPGPGICFGGEPLAAAEVGSTGTATLAVTNCGNAPLTVSSVQLASPVFALAAGDTCTGGIAAGESCDIPISFTPSVAGNAGANLLLTTNAPVPNYSVPVAGFGTAPAITIYPPTVQFQEQVLGAPGTNVQVQVVNDGTAFLVVNTTSTVITGNFSIVSNTCSSSVAPGSACTYTLSFVPVSAGTSAGNLTIVSNDPVNPSVAVPLSGTAVASYTTPSVTGFQTPPSIALNSPTATFTISGTNFFPTSYVTVDGEPLSTTYISATSLQVTLDPTLLTTVGELPVTVVNPEPGGQSESIPLTVYQSLPISATGLAYASLTQMLYAASPQGATSNPNTILPINPLTGVVGTPIPVGTDPGKLVVSEDGSYLYVALNAGHALQRINLATLEVEATFPLPADPSFGATTVNDMHVVPGTPTSIVATLLRNASPAEAGAALFNASGLVSFVSSDSQSDYSPDAFSFTSNPTAIYTLPFASNFFGITTVSATTLTPVSSGFGCCSETNGALVASDGTLLYTNAGQVWNPATQALVGTYTISQPPGLFYEPTVLPDASLQRTFFLDAFYNSSANIFSFNSSNFSQTGTVTIALQNYPDSEDLVRWGSDGFAFRVYNYGSSDHSTDQLLLVRSSIAHTATGGSPAIQSFTPASVTVGSATLTITVNGSGLLPGSIVLWNGSPRLTSYVSATQLTALVPSTDVTSAGTAQITVSNPAPGTTSSAQPFQIIAAIVSLNQSSLNFGAQGVGTASSAQQVTISNTGGTTVSGLALLLGGSNAPSFAETSNCGSTLAVGASCMINVVFTPAMSGALQASLVLADNAAGSPQTVALSGTGVSPTVSLSSTSLSFGAQSISAASPAQQVTLTNSGSIPAAGLVVTVAGANASDFVETSNCGSTLAAGATCNVSVIFTPSASGAEQALLVFTDNATGSPQAIALTGTGVAPSFSLMPPSETASTVTVQAGQPASYALALSSTGGFTGTVSLSCTDLPRYASCSFSPAMVNLSASGASTSTLTVSTQSSSTSTAKLFDFGGATLGLAAMLLLPAARARRQLYGGLIVMAVLLIAAVAGLSGCGGGSTHSGAPAPLQTSAGTYTISVVATSGSDIQKIPVTLIVQ